MQKNVSTPKWEDFTKTKKPENMETKNTVEEKRKEEEQREPIPEESVEPATENETVLETQEATEEQEELSEELVELAKVKQERDEYLNHLKRLQAEFDNFRKRTQKERIELKEYLIEDIMRKLVEVVENMERALHPDNQTTDIESYRSGVEMVYNKMMSILQEYGLVRLESVGKPFDPRFHEAVMNIETEEYEPGTVVAEFTPGYCLKDRVLQAPKVQVATQPAEKKEEQ